METHILKTVGPYYALIEEQEGVPAILRTLQGVVSVSLQQRKNELCQKNDALKKGPRSQKVTSWLQEWELALGTANTLGMTDLLTNYQPTRAFLNAVSSLHPYFSNRYLQDLDTALELDPQSTSFPAGIEIARKFRRTYASQEKTPPVSGAFPGATLQGKEAPEQKGPKKCLDDRRGHLPSTCGGRGGAGGPGGGKISLPHAKSLLEKLESDSSLKRQYAEAYAELTTLTAEKDPAGNSDLKERVKGLAATAFSATPAVYPLQESTILDTGGADHVSNNLDNLIPGSFRPCGPIPVFAGTQKVFI